MPSLRPFSLSPLMLALLVSSSHAIDAYAQSPRERAREAFESEERESSRARDQDTDGDRDRELLENRDRDTYRDRDRDWEQSFNDRGDVRSGPRDGGIRWSDVPESRGADAPERGTEEGMPAPAMGSRGFGTNPQLIPAARFEWKLGVYAENTDTGVVITRVVPRSAAWDHGLEPGDRILAVDGFQVGWIKDYLFPLGAELQRRANQRGEVTLLLQNVRNRRVVPRNIQLDRARGR